MTPNPNGKVTIIGAGLVGSLWAVLLRKRNFDVEVFEKRSDIRKVQTDGGRSINLIITSRGEYALEQAGLLQEAIKLSVPVLGRMIHPKTSGELIFQPYGKETERNLSISRTALNQFLINAAERAGAKIHFDHSLEKIDFKEKQLLFNYDRKISYDTLFGTDGAGSLVRKNMVETFPEDYIEKTDWLAADYKELSLPRPNSLDKKALHIWPRGSHMMMALANLDGSFTVTLYLPKVGSISFQNNKTPKEIQELFQNEFPDALPLMPNYLRDFERNPQGALGTIRCSKWNYENSVMLMGDAAHAIVPFFGQGMNSGFEDCTEMLKIMDEKSNWEECFKEFNEVRPADANAIADMAVENWIEISEKVADPKFLLRKKAEALLEKNFPALFKSRYGMVTYSRIPYSIVQKAGQLQEQIFSSMLKGLESADDLDLTKAEATLQKKYAPFLKEHGLFHS